MVLGLERKEIILITVILIVLILAVLSILNSDALSGKIVSIEKSYSQLNLSYASNYNKLSAEYETIVSNYSALKTNYTVLNAKYSQILYNLTNPARQKLFSESSINLAPVNITYLYYNYSTESAWYKQSCGIYNYSFYAKSDGYLIMNMTSTIPNAPPTNLQNNQNTSYSFAIYVSASRPVNMTPSTASNKTIVYQYPCSLFFNPKTSPETTIIPYGETNYIIPVQKGMNYLLIKNQNQKVESLALNLEFVEYPYTN